MLDCRIVMQISISSNNIIILNSSAGGNEKKQASKHSKVVTLDLQYNYAYSAWKLPDTHIWSDYFI